MNKFNKTIVFIWFALFIFAGFYALKVPGILTGNGFEKEGTFSKTEEILQKDFHFPKQSLILVFEDKKKLGEEQLKKGNESIISKIDDVYGVKNISIPEYKYPYAYVSISLEDGLDDLDKTISDITKILKKEKNIETSLTGAPIIEEEMNKSSQNDLKNAELIGLPIALIVLIFAFGSLVAAGIPLLIGVVSVVVTMGLTYFVGSYIELSVFVLNVVPMIGLALSIDFALLYINRFRDELKGNSVHDAIKTTTKTAGRSIAFSGLCVLLGLSGMLFIDIDIFRSVAIGGISVVFISVVSALTFLPSLLVLLGNKINKGMILKQKEVEVSNWRKFAIFVMKRPVVMTVSTLILLLVALFPIHNIELEIPDVTALPKDSEIRMNYEKFEKHFLPKNESKVYVILKGKEKATDEKTIELMEESIHKIKNEKHVKNVTSFLSISGDMDAKTFHQMYQIPEYKDRLNSVLKQFTSGNQTLLIVTLDVNASSDNAKDWVRKMEDKDLPLEFAIGGYAKYNQEIFDEIYKQAPKGLFMILVSTYIILFIAFRSVIIPLKAIVMNMFSLGAAFGMVVWIFQGGHFGIHETNIALMIPIMAFAIVFGLSMDYEVFLISRIQEEYKKTKNNHQATLDGLTNTSKVITSAAAIMIVITGAFAFTDIVPVKQIGIAVALSIFIDATIVRMILVPSLMKLLGDWNWWTPFGKK